MMTRIQCFLTATLMVQNSAAFTLQVGHIQRSQLGTELRSQATYPEGEAMFVMAKASECANSELCSIEEAESFLHEVLHLQSDCAADNIRNHDVCDDITIPNEIIAGLRYKIEASART